MDHPLAECKLSQRTGARLETEQINYNGFLSYPILFSNKTYKSYSPVQMDHTMMQDTATFHSVSSDVVWNMLEGEEQARRKFSQHIYEFTHTWHPSFWLSHSLCQ